MTALEHIPPRRRRAAALRRVAAVPVVQFAVLGGLLFASQHWWLSGHPPPAPAGRDPIVVSRGDVERWRQASTAGGDGTADAADAAARLDDAIDDEVLLREALAHGLDRGDRAVRARLVKLGRFLGLAPGGDDDAVEREARALGFVRSDVVVRRHLVEVMRLAASRPGRADLPSAAELRAYYQRNGARFAIPARLRLTHVFLSRERGAAQAAHDAERLLAMLRARGAGAQDAAALGDPFVRGASIPPSSPRQLAQIFGPTFAAAVAALPLRTWSGPLPSSYGSHLVWIDEILPAAAPPLDAVRNRVLHELLRTRGDQHLHDTLQAMRARYDVRIEPAAGAATGPTGG